MKRFLAIGGVVLAVLIAVWVARDRSETRRPSSSSRTEGRAPALRWSSGAGDEDPETRAPRDADAGAVTGRVVDAIDGRPIEGATLTLRNAAGEELAESWSDAGGAFSFEEAGAATIVAASAPGYAIRARELSFTGDIVLELDGAVSVSGIVVGPGGNPIDGAEVWVEDDERRWFRPPAVSGSARTDAEGRFAIEDSPSGSLVVHALHPEFASASVELGGLGPGRTKENVRVELGDTGALSGLVTDENGEPAGGAKMSWMPADRERWREEKTTVSAGADGRFRFPHLPAGRGIVRAMTSTADGASEASIEAGGEASADVTVIGEPVFSGVVVNVADEPVAGATVSVGFGWEGPDEDDDSPLHRMQRRRGERWQAVSDAQGRFAIHAPARGEVTLSARTTSAAGRVTGVRPGDAPVRIRLEAMGIARIRLVGADGAPFRGEAAVRVRMSSANGRVRNGLVDDFDASGEGSLEAEPGEWSFRVVIEERGGAERRVGSPTGGRMADQGRIEERGGAERRVGSPTEGRMADQGRIDGSGEGEEVRVNVPAAPPETVVTLRVDTPAAARGTVRGRVAGPDGAPVVAARISVLEESRDWAGGRGARLDWGAAVRSDAAGRFTIEAPPGTQKLFVYHPEFRTELATVVVPSEGETDAGVIRLDVGTGSSAVFEFSGIGAVLSLDEAHRCIIRDVVAGGPAERAGLRAKDVILEVDGAALHGMGLGDVVERIRGPDGTTVSLLVEREGNLEPFALDVMREKIRA